MSTQDYLASEGKDGFSQSDRLLRMLLPENIEIDSGDPAALMLRAARTAVQFNYYNSANEIDGDWQGFFLSDFNILALMISALDYGPYIKTYDRQLKELRYAADDASLRDSSRGLIDAVTSLADVLILLLEKVTAVSLPVDIAPTMSSILDKVREIRDRAAAPSSTLLPTLQSAFSDLLIQYNRIQEIAGYYRRNNDWTTQQYHPHVALLITFLHLYGYVSAQINRLTRSHLDYYYREILGLESIPEIPDQVHLLFAPEVNAGHLHLPAGQEMPAKIPGRDAPLKYRLTADITVTKAKIAALRTLFTGDRPIFPDDDPDHRLIRNVRLYQGDYPCILPEVLLNGNAPAAWPLFGEDQEDLGMDQQSMMDAATGLLLASPIFYLQEGERTIRLTFYFIPSSFSELSTYITRFAAASRKTEEAAQHQLLSRAFQIDFTAADGWSAVDRYSASTPGSNMLQILVELDPRAKPFVGYQPAIHGADLQTALESPDQRASLPVLRLLINNASPHNGLSFFRSLQIERIQLQSEVHHFRLVRMQNSIGNLAADSAFQPFGPLPAVGSYLDIKNSNVFNRYTTDISLCLEWMDLPTDPGGFSAWYAGYGTGVTDDSFRIGIGALVNGTAQPATARQQSFPLYSHNPDDNGNGPAPVTWIKDIDMNRLEFSNAPLLAREEEEADGFFRNGAIRIGLLSPPEAFGHALFPRIFPEAAIHNAQWWHKRRPLPNQPYTPRAKSVSIDYTLRYAEAFKDPMESDGGLRLIHQYPFGFRRIYPGNDLRTISFLPSIDPGGHLHIGLSHVGRREQLSLLFQLEERNFHHTLHDTGTVTFSYLQDDEWVAMDAAAILSDTTNGFINSGIVRLKLPAQPGVSHSTWPAGLFWIRISLQGAEDMNSRVVAVLAQAAMAQRVPEQDTIVAPAVLAGALTNFSLPPGAITNLARKVLGLQQIVQPFPSFGGRAVEQDAAYYTRVSERLRHKRRPLTSLDIEQLVLQRFPSIAVVKCFGTTNKRPSVYPGVDLQVILIPKEGVDGSLYNDQPKVNLATLFAVKNYLAGFSSPFINIEIGNPVYEKIKISCRIRLADHPDGGSDGYYLKTLHEDIRRYFCPWIYVPGSDVKIGTRIYIPELLTFISRLPYIAELTGFSVIHFFNIKDPATGELRGALIDSALHKVEYIQGSVPEAVLIPSAHHLITLLSAEDDAGPAPAGISNFSIGEELLVSVAEHARHEGYDEEPASRQDDDQVFQLNLQNIPDEQS
jgi:hypothetical protein